eukprot:TRINITY_DN6840_c0_g3_i2.p1 TRINITY_DN6840_c0_g3~~TRINITY_DN6840_c0_g3_i2.p1  ORF type:complete len:210 (-),score=38.85 TRINITY_DN6840_c0_g3_i2:336-965(-)
MKKGRNKRLRIWAYYSPSDRRERNKFLEQLDAYMKEKLSREDMNILAGDSNLVIHPQDKAGKIGNSESIKQGIRLKEIMNKYGMQEIYRHFKKNTPIKEEWTHETTKTTNKGRIKTQARIDHFWTDNMDQIYDVKMDMDYELSDHRPMFIVLLKEKGEDQAQGSRGMAVRRKKHMVDMTKPEEIQSFKTTLEAMTKTLSPVLCVDTTAS